MADNSQASGALRAWVRKLRSLPELAKEAAPAVADAVEAVLHKQIASSVDPNGAPLQLTQQGAAPLTGAAKALHVGNIGSTVVARLTGPEARHSLGRAKGGIVRQIMPTELTDKLSEATVKAVEQAWEEHWRG